MEEIKNICANGLVIHIKENDVVSNEEYFALLCQSGAKNDLKYCGTAHFTEHMLLEGVKRKLSCILNEFVVQGKTGIDRIVFFYHAKAHMKILKLFLKCFMI